MQVGNRYRRRIGSNSPFPGHSALSAIAAPGIHLEGRGRERFLMSCWCGHGPWHHDRYSYPPPGYPPPEPYGRPRRRRLDADELADYLQELGEEIARVRRDLDEIRGSGTTEP